MSISKLQIKSGLVLGSCFFILYVFTLSQHFTGDSLMFASEINTGQLSIMMPRHRVLADALGYSFVSLWNLLAGSNALLQPLQVFNALCGAIAVVFVFYILTMLTASRKVALLTAVGFGASNGIWLFSIEAEMVTPALAEMIAVLMLAAGFAATRLVRRRHIVVAGLLTGFAILTYAQNLLLVFIVILAIMLSSNRFARKLSDGLLFVITVTVATAAAYFVYFFYVVGHIPLSGASFYQGQGSGLLYGTLSVKNIPYGVYAFLKTVMNYPLLPCDEFTRTFLSSASWPSRLGFLAFELIVLALVVAPLWEIVRSWRDYSRSYRANILLFTVWSALFAAFAFYWVPKDMQFWLPVTAGWWLLAGIGLAHKITHQPQRPWYGAAILIVGLVIAVNFAGSVLPRQSLESNREYMIAVSIKDHTQPQDLVVTISDNRNIQFFSERKTISLLETILCGQASRTDNAKAWMIQQLANEMAVVQKNEGRVFLYIEKFDAEALATYAKVGLIPSDLQYLETIPAWSAYDAEFVEILGLRQYLSDASNQYIQPISLFTSPAEF